MVTSHLIPCKKPTHYAKWSYEKHSDTLMLYVPAGSDPFTWGSDKVGEQWPNLQGHRVEVFACK